MGKEIQELLQAAEEEVATKKIPTKATKGTKAAKAAKGTKAAKVAKVDPETLVPEELVAAIEKRFLQVAGLSGELSHFPIDRSNHLQVKTNKSKSDKHGEVFSPLWLVDQMIESLDDTSIRDTRRTYRDLCAGYGQFTVRLLRKKVTLLGAKFNVHDFLENYHMFVELQPNSCYRLLYIYGTGITLAIGDACQLGKLPDTAEKGIWVWCLADSVWKDMTHKVVKKFNDIRNKGAEHGIEKQAEQFEEWFNRIQERAQGRGNRN